MYRPDPLRAMPGGVIRHIGGEVNGAIYPRAHSGFSICCRIE